MKQEGRRYGLTHPQQRIWYTEKLHPGTGMWNNAGTLKIKGVVDYELLNEAVNMFLHDDDSIRLRIGVEEGVPYQYVADYVPYKMDFKDFSDRGVKKLYEWDIVQTEAPMPLIDSNLFYIALMKLGDDEGWFYAKFHHIISDALTMVYFGNQVMSYYQSLLDGKEVVREKWRTYTEFLDDEEKYMQSKRFLSDQKYWTEKFKNLPEPTVIKQKKTNYISTKAKRKAFVIPAQLSRQIRLYCQDAGVSIFSLFLSALAIYIKRITNKDDIIIGAPVANRPFLSSKQSFGMFISMVPVRIGIEDRLSSKEFTDVVTGKWFSVLKHQKYPYDILMQDLRKEHKGLESLYDVTFSYQIGKFKKDTEHFHYESRWHFSGYQTTPLSIHVNDREDNGRFVVDYDYQTPLFSDKEIEYIHAHMNNILQDMIENPDKPIYMLNLMSDEERDRVINRFNNTDHDFPQGETLVDLWYQNMKKTPRDAIAVVNDGQSMTYGELDSRSSALALYLNKQGVGVDSVVGLLVGRTIDFCVSVLAILKAGSAYLPIDAELPRERVAYMLSDSGVEVLLVSPSLAGKCPDIEGLHVVRTNIPLALPDKTYIVPKCGPQDLAYVIYTSGSTGQPKGVQIEHRSIVHFIYSLNEIWDFSEGARLLGAASISFDISVMELVLSLMNGAVLVLAQEHEVNIPKNMVRLIESQEVNMLVVTPGRMELLLSDKRGAACLQDFREIGLGGDVLSEKLLERVQQSTRARITNFYGPTEITVCATCTDVTHAKVPNIGRPMHNVKAYILDEHMNPMPIGVPGELYLGGCGVARGYINKPELNSERFVDSPFIEGHKLYRTGDLTRWYPLGEIEFLGRIDKQVKVRGYRIELGEIENRLMQVPGVTACTVTDRIDTAGRKFLCAYLCGNPPKKAEIRSRLERELPVYMIPSYFINIEAIPFNASGKIDRDSLPDPLTAGDLAAEDYIPPETATERILADIWSSTLNTGQIGRYDSFFDIGGDSLTIVHVMAQVMQKFLVDISLEDVYHSPSLKDIAMMIDRAEQFAYRPIVAAPDERDYPVSSAQQRMWVVSQGEQKTTAYNIPVAFEIDGRLDIPRLQRAFGKLIDRHDALRTTFELKGQFLRQMIHDKADFEMEMIKGSTEKVDMILRALVRPFDFEKAPLMHTALLRIDENRHILFIDMHHSISDKRSLEILFHDLASYYAGRQPAEKSIEYKDYTVWQNEFFQSENIALQRDFWQSALSGELPLLNLHTDRPRGPAQRFDGARMRFRVPQKTADNMRAFAQQRGATLFMTVLAVYNIFLAKYTGQEDIIIGAPVSGRMRPEIQDTMGVFINTLPLRNYPRREMSFSGFFGELDQNVKAAFAHSDYPIERIVADLSLPRDLSRNPLFDTMLVMANGTFHLDMDGLECRYHQLDPKVAKLDLTLEVYEEEDGLECQIEYNTRLFRRVTIKHMSAHLCRLFDILIDEPETRIGDVAILTQEELWKVTQGFNQTDQPLEERTLQSLFEAQAASQGSKTALIHDGKTITFSALNQRANQIAWWLRGKGIGRNTIVALCIRRSFDMLAGLLGILKAGGGYFPLDPEYPPERVSFMLSDSGTEALLTDSDIRYDFKGNVFCLQDMPEDMGKENPPPIDRMEDAAYVIYTSGSTGTPKGALLPRRALLNLYEGTKTTIAYDKNQTSVSVTTVSFDIFVIDALLPLLFGCTVALCTEEELRQPYLLAALIKAADVKFIQTTPTRMRIMMEDASFREAARTHIEKIVLGGEEFPLSLLKLLKKHTTARIISGYGPTETTVYCTFKDLSNTSHITIGRPIINTRMYILDPNRRPVPIGVLGEAYISGACVATGYINREELNRRKFLPDPFLPGHVMYQSGDICAFMENGEMEIRGRSDHQVKIRGLRIELGEIEAALRKVDGIKEAVVKDWGEGANKFLCAYYAADKTMDDGILRSRLSQKLPAYMVPSYLIGMKELPMTLNGKVNRGALPQPKKPAGPKWPRTDYINEAEKKMARVWSRILKVDAIEPDDNFFALGGDSLSVIKVQAAILQYGWTIRTKVFYDQQTLRAICSHLETGRSAPTRDIVKMTAPVKSNRLIPTYSHLAPAKLKNILLTGATGYLGAHILELLTRMPDRQVFCLVRGQDKKSCERYLREVLTFYFGVETCQRIFLRAAVIKGNISNDRLGLSDEDFNRLAGMDTVIHSAALTDHVGRADAFYQTNVLGTKHIVALAAEIKATLLHVSTVSVSGTYYMDDHNRKGEFTENSYYIGQNYMDNDYVKSKFQAEKIVMKAVDKGLDARIFRVGVLTGTLDGRFQMRPEKNAFANRIKALCTVGCVPESMLSTWIEMTPVDACTEAMLALAAQSDSNRLVYHVFNTNMMTVRELVAMLEENGHAIETVSDQEFLSRMTQLSRRGNYAPFVGLIEDISEDHADNITVTADLTEPLLAGLGFSWPVIDAEYIDGFVNCIHHRQSKEI